MLTGGFRGETAKTELLDMRMAHGLIGGLFLAFGTASFIQDQRHYATMASAPGTVLRLVRLAKRSDPLVSWAARALSDAFSSTRSPAPA